MKITLALAALFIVIIGGGFVWKVLLVPSTASSTAPVAAAAATASSNYTAAQVATHKSDSSCWTIINGNVYNLTSWISQHPGGPEHIEAICGIDGTSAFEGQHGNEAQPNAILATFKIGTLAK